MILLNCYRPALAATVFLAAMALPGGAAEAQNNTAPFATGTRCGSLSEPRRSACSDAFDPRTNPREWQQRDNPAVLSPPEPSALGRPPATTAPKAPHQPILNPTPSLPRFRPPG